MGNTILLLSPTENSAQIPLLQAEKKHQPYGSAVQVKFPEVKEFTLNNGLRVAMVERHAVPVVTMSLLVNAGYAADQFGKPGLAALTMKMMKEGTTTRNALQLSDQVADLGASLYTFSSLDNSYVIYECIETKLKRIS